MSQNWYSRRQPTPAAAHSVERWRFLRRNCLCLLLLLAAPFARAADTAWQLNGLASYSQLSKEYYLVALYTPQPVTTPAALLDPNLAKRAVLKITAKQWTPFSFSEIWKRDLSINNELSSDTPYISELLAFTAFPKVDLTSGDTIEIEWTPGARTRVRFNGSEVLSAPDHSLMAYILNVWVGSSPPSRAFRSDLLAGGTGKVQGGDNLMARLDAIKVQPGREKLLATWKAEESAQLRRKNEAAARKLAEEEAERKRRDEAEARKKAEEEEARKRAADAAARKAEAERVAARAKEEARQARERAEQQRKVAETASRGTTTSSGSRQSAPATGSGTAAAAAEAALVEAERIQLEAVEAAKLAAQQAEAQRKAEEDARRLQAERMALAGYEYDRSYYAWQIQREVSAKVVYPAWSRQFGEEGTVVLDLKLRPDGQVESITRIEPEEEGPLVVAVRSAIERSAPFPPPPRQPLAGSAPAEKSVTYRVNHEFRAELGSVETAPPVMPESLKEFRTGHLSDEEKASRLDNYQNSIRRTIENSISYPHWAKSLRQTGDVGVSVMLLPDGSVKEIVFREKSKHDLLNKEVVDAVNRSAPFPPIPIELTDQPVRVEIDHSFKR